MELDETGQWQFTDEQYEPPVPLTEPEAEFDIDDTMTWPYSIRGSLDGDDDAFRDQLSEAVKEYFRRTPGRSLYDFSRARLNLWIDASGKSGQVVVRLTAGRRRRQEIEYHFDKDESGRWRFDQWGSSGSWSY